MDWQLALVGIMVAAAALYLARASWHSWRSGKAGCSGGCCSTGKEAPSKNGSSAIPLISEDQLTARLRKGTRP